MKRHPNLRGLIKLGLFALGFVLLILFADTHLIQTDTIARMTLHEMQEREDIELAFVGSSIVRDHFNAQRITEETGLNAFCATVPTASMPASIALTRELQRTNTPEWIVLVTEPYNFQTVREAPEAQYKLMPFLSDPANMLDYYLRTSREDGYYFDRLLMFREFGAQNLSDVAKTIGLRYFPERTYARLRETMDPTVSYQGSGFLRHETDERADELLRTVQREYTGYTYELYDGSREQLETYRQLCEENGSNLMVVIFPNHTAHALAEPGFLDYNDSLMAYCEEMGVPCFNFSFARPELMPNLDGYFYDLYHMVGEGADILSDAFCRVFSAYTAGEDVSSLFYANRWEYLDSLTFTTNVWLTPFDPDSEWNPALEQDEARVRELAKTQDVYLADCNHYVVYTPEYRFVLKNADGSETLLQDYGVDTLYACAPGALSGQTLRVYARLQDYPENGEVWYELTIEQSSLDCRGILLYNRGCGWMSAACYLYHAHLGVLMMKYLILDDLEATAARLPHKTAFADEGSAVTFAELVRLSRAVGSALLPRVSPRTTVGFYMDKSVQTVAGFFGAVYAGCAYSQLNLRHPAVRIRAILETLASPVVVTDRAHEEALRAMDVPGDILILEDLLESTIDEAALERVRAQMLDIDPLYVNFTSGSTGTPKGVIICHRNVRDFIPCFTEIFGITESDVLANQAPFDFDVSVKDIYSGVFTGATVQIIPTAYFTQPTKLMDFLCDRGATVLVWAVSALCFITTMNALDYRVPDKLRAIMFSGEVMPIKHLNKLKKYLPDAMYVNLYGPTEITCNCTYYIVDRAFEPGESLPIGVPFPNERILLLDEQDQEVSPGGTGELCVSGTAVALGYFGDSERTRAAFVQNPLNKTHLETIYRTGDLVRLTEQGELVYVSRKDFQIKHMGHRIELGEIETALSAVPGVERALCMYLHDKGKILAFTMGEADKAAITAALHETLPAYMIPNIFMQVDEMPMTKNGKIDRNALMELYQNRKRGARNG